MINGDALVTSRAQEPMYLGRRRRNSLRGHREEHDKLQLSGPFAGVSAYLGRRRNTINGDTLVTSREREPT